MANILYLEWGSFAGKFIERAWKKKGDTYVTFKIDTRANTRFGEELTKAIVMKLMENHFDYMFSFNYFPVAALAAKATRVRYISYVYDSPYAMLYSNTIFLETNRIFVFDKREAEKLRAKGANTVYYLPLATDVDYYDSLPWKNKYTTDISFVGQLYNDERQSLYKRFEKLDAYTRGYLDGIVDLQKNLYGMNVLEEMLNPTLVSKLEEASPLMEHPDAFATKEWTYANFYLYREVTRRERTLIAESLKNYDFKAYTGLDYYKEAPYVYRNSKINLNITLRSISSGIPLRVFDIMGNGGFVLTNYQEDLLEYFEPDIDFVYYEDQADLIKKIDYYLCHDKEREKIALNGYEKVKAHHNFYDRLDSFNF